MKKNIELTNKKQAIELVQLKMQLTAQIEKLNESQRLAKIGSWEWDILTAEVTWSDMMYELLGLQADQEPSYDLALKYVHIDDKEEYVKNLEHSLEHGIDYYFKNRIQRDDGFVIPVISRGKCFKNSNHDVIRMIGTVQDISTRKKLLQENEELRQFALLASNDIESPLLTIDKFSSLLSKKYYDLIEEDAKMYLTFIRHATKKLKSQINDLLDYFELGQNKTSTFININDLVKEVLDQLTDEIKDSNCSFEIDALPSVQGYKTELALLFKNLITNAIKFRKKDLDPVISIECTKETGFWKFIITDNGIGIKEINLNRMFTLFERLHYSDEYEGTGIGLAQSKKIVDLHGGSIWATSIYNLGSSFYFTLRA